MADVKLSAEDERSIMNTDGKAGVGIQVEAQSKANMLDVAEGMRAAIERIKPGLPKGMSLVVNMDNAIAIEAALHEVVIALALAFVSVLIVIYAFLGSMRATLIPAVTIPVSIIATFTAMYALGYTINVLTLLALVLAIGLVVDDAIVVLENIFRRAEEGEPTVVAAINGSKEIGFAVIATTLTLAAVFVPISFLPGDIGRLFREFGFTLAASVLFSALIALTLTPMLASKANWSTMKHNRFAAAVDRFFERFSARYQRRLRSLIRRPWLIVGGVVRSDGRRRTDVPLPAERIRADGGRGSHRGVHGSAGRFELRIHARATPRSSKPSSRRNVAQYDDIDRVMLRLPGNFDGGGDVNSARVFLVLKDWHERKRTAQQIGQSIARKAQCDSRCAHQYVLTRRTGPRLRQADPGIARRPGLRAAVGLVEAAHGSGRGEPGPDRTSIRTTRSASRRSACPWIAIARRTSASRCRPIGSTLETMLGSRIVTTYVDRGREYNVILQSRADERATTTDLTNIQVRSDRTGQLIPLSNLVTLHEIAGATSLNRFNRIRSIEISAGLADGYTMGEAVKWFQDTVREKLPAGASLAFNGESGRVPEERRPALCDVRVRDRHRVPGAGRAVRKLHPPGHHHGDGAARAARRRVWPQALRAEHQHLQPDRGGHARGHRRQERRADRRVREPAS